MIGYTNDLDGYIANMKEILKNTKEPEDKTFKMFVGFAVRTAEEFKSRANSGGE